jgi:hypothetical protein
MTTGQSSGPSSRLVFFELHRGKPWTRVVVRAQRHARKSQSEQGVRDAATARRGYKRAMALNRRRQARLSRRRGRSGYLRRVKCFWAWPWGHDIKHGRCIRCGKRR